MHTAAALTSSRGVGAIATIEVTGDNAGKIVSEIFLPRGQCDYNTHRSYLGQIRDGQQIIDEVSLGMEAQNLFAIHCHGNPLIVRRIMDLLKKKGCELLSYQDFQILKHSPACLNSIELEAAVRMPEAATLTGSKIIDIQKRAGLNKITSDWLNNFKKYSSAEITEQAKQIIENSQVAKYYISGLKVVLLGPPNSGKSTLINNLSGEKKAIVSNIEGTTRDFVTAQCRIGPLLAEVFDTAGLDQVLIQKKGKLEKLSQEVSLKIIKDADMLLLVLDSTDLMPEFNKTFLAEIKGKKVLTVLNKSDKPQKLDTGKLPEFTAECVRISALKDPALKELKQKILYYSGVLDYDLNSAAAFTERQMKLLQTISETESRTKIFEILQQLFNENLDTR